MSNGGFGRGALGAAMPSPGLRRLSLLQAVREHVAANMPTYVFLSFFFLTAVVANIAYTTPWGRDWPARFINHFAWNNFRVPFQLGFWTLVLLPFVATPVVASLTRRVSTPLATRTAGNFQDFSKPVYCALCAALYAYVFYSLYRSDAAYQLLSAPDARQAIEARFKTLAELGYWPQMVMKSLLVFLAVYAAVKAARRGGKFWMAAVIWHSVALTLCLVLLNMKWPVVVFQITLGLSVLVTAERYPLLKSGAVMVLAVATYFLVAVLLLRMVPPRPTQAAPEIPKVDAAPAVPAPVVPQPTAAIQLDTKYAREAVHTAQRSMPVLAVQALNRMAVAVPFYYDIFTAEGQICGTMTDRILRRSNSAHPSIVVYTRMYRGDGFEGRGTAPAAVHITGYAFGGWVGAISALMVGSILIGLFLALWPAAQTNDTLAAAFVMGGYAAYFLSQVPLEGALIYDHGMLWWSALILLQAGINGLWRFLASRAATRSPSLEACSR